MTWKIDDPQGNHKLVTIYGLSSSQTGDIRYIGQTTQSLQKRLDSHIHSPKSHRRRHCSMWIKSVLKKGHKVLIKVLYENAVWNETEQDLIRVFREMGARLANHTDGGGGVRSRIWTPEQRKHQSEKRKGIVFSDEHRENLKRALKGRKMPDDFGERVSRAMKGKSPSNLLSIQASVRGKAKTQEHRAKISATLKGRNVRLEAKRGLAH